MKKYMTFAALTACLSIAALAQEQAEETPKSAALTPDQILAKAPDDHWLPIPVSDLLVMKLPDSADGRSREIIIQLLPKIFEQGHVRNVRKLAAAGWWNDTKIYRVQRDFVTQFGGNPLGKKPLPGLTTPPESEYHYPAMLKRRDRDMAALKQQVDYGNQYGGTHIKPLNKLIWEGYGAKVGFGAGWPIGSKQGPNGPVAYPLMCKGHLSPAHYDPPDTGDGREISIMTGKNGRGLDMKFANVGRVIEGLEHAINLPAGVGETGFYADKADMIKVVSIKPATSLPPEKQPHFEYLASYSPYLLRYIQAKNVYESICDHPVPIRRKKI